MAEQQGHFIVLEGIDGCGSTTQAKLLVAALAQRQIRAALTCEPSGGRIGRLIREILSTGLASTSGETPPTLDGPPSLGRRFDWAAMALLFAADRLDHLDSEVLPALKRGVTLVSDRYDLSSVAYQSATAPRAHAAEDIAAWIRELNRHAVRPELTLVLDMPAEVAEARRAERGGKPEIYEYADLQRQLAELYAKAESLVPGDRLVHVSALGTVQEVHERILQICLAGFGSA